MLLHRNIISQLLREGDRNRGRHFLAAFGVAPEVRVVVSGAPTQSVAVPGKGHARDNDQVQTWNKLKAHEITNRSRGSAACMHSKAFTKN